jgi:hypothetical protein
MPTVIFCHNFRGVQAYLLAQRQGGTLVTFDDQLLKAAKKEKGLTA